MNTFLVIVYICVATAAVLFGLAARHRYKRKQESYIYYVILAVVAAVYVIAAAFGIT